MKLCLFVAVFCISTFLHAQNKLVFIKADSSQTITLQQKDLVRLSYKGYMNQPQEAEGFITSLTDSTITLSPRKKLFQKIKNAQTFLIKDINGFRRYSKFRPASEIIYSFVSIGITGTVTAIISNASVPAELSFLSAAGTQTVTTVMKNVIFSSKIKNSLSAGWIMQLVKSNP